MPQALGLAPALALLRAAPTCPTARRPHSLATGPGTASPLAAGWWEPGQTCHSSMPTLAPSLSALATYQLCQPLPGPQRYDCVPTGGALWAWGKALLSGGSPRPSGTCCWALKLCWRPGCPLQVTSPLGPRREVGRSRRQGSHLQGVPGGGVAGVEALRVTEGPLPREVPGWGLCPPGSWPLPRHLLFPERQPTTPPPCTLDGRTPRSYAAPPGHQRPRRPDGAPRRRGAGLLAPPF